MQKPWDQFPTPAHTVSAAVASASSVSSCTTVQASNPTVVTLAIIGAGLAGCWLARILAEQGIAVSLFEQNSAVATAASGNPAGIVKPFVTRSPSSGMSFHCQAHAFLIDQLAALNLENAAGFSRCGVMQLVQDAYPASEHYSNLKNASAEQQAGTALNSNTLLFANSGWLNPNKLCESLVEHPLIQLKLGTRVAQWSPQDHGVEHTLKLSDGNVVHASQLVITTGAATHLIPGYEHIPLMPARGQISRFALTQSIVAPQCVISGKHYVIPDKHSVLVGATFERGDSSNSVTDADHAVNFAGLRQLLPELNVEPKALNGYAGVRATTPDRLPVVGPLPDFAQASSVYHDIRHGKSLHTYPQLPCIDGAYLIGGLGSRGIVTAPFCAQLLANYLSTNTDHFTVDIQQDPIPADVNTTNLNDWAPLLNPARFLIRNLKRSTT